VARLSGQIALLLIAVLAIAPSAAQPSIDWQLAVGGGSLDYAKEIHQTADGGYIIAAYTGSTDGDVLDNHGFNDAWVVKLDGSGSIAWQSTLGGSSDDRAYSIDQTADGGYIMAGSTGSSDGDVTGSHGGPADVWLVKLDQNGTLLWQKCLGGTGEDVAYAVRQTSDGGYVFAGNTTSDDWDVSGNHGGSDYWVVKVDTVGGVVWQATIGGSDYDIAASIRETSDGGYVVAGRSHSMDGDVTSGHGDADAWIVKLDANGALVAQHALGGSSYDRVSSIEESTDGGFIAIGTSMSNDGDVSGSHGSGGDAWVVKLDAGLGLSWQKALGGSNVDSGNSIQQEVDGGYVLLGMSASNNGDVTLNHGPFDYWIAKIDAIGNVEWQLTMGGDGSDEGVCLDRTTDGGYVCCGDIKSFDGDVTGFHGAKDGWVVKVSDVSTNVEEEHEPSLVIRPGEGGQILHVTTIENVTDATICLINSAGQQVACERMSGRQHALSIGHLPSGSYLLVLGSGSSTLSGTFVKE